METELGNKIKEILSRNGLNRVNGLNITEWEPRNHTVMFKMKNKFFEGFVDILTSSNGSFSVAFCADNRLFVKGTICSESDLFFILENAGNSGQRAPKGAPEPKASFFVNS